MPSKSFLSIQFQSQTLPDGSVCGDPDLGICQQSSCVENECVFTPTQFELSQTCLCGACVECDETSENCGGNCQFFSKNNTDGITPKPPTSLLLSVPCKYDFIWASVAGCDPFQFFRNEEGYFNITKPVGDPSCNTNPGLQPRLLFLGEVNGEITAYGDPPYNASNPGGNTDCTAFDERPECVCNWIEFCKPDGTWEIHTSCSYPLFIGQTYGPQQDMIISGYCQKSGVSFICSCNYIEYDTSMH